MPVLHKRKSKDSYYVLTSINGQVVTFQLTAEGHRYLREVGIVTKKPFGRFLLLDLYRKGYAFTGHGGIDVIPGQGILDFPNDPEPETMFPSCAACSSPEDLHLVEIKDHKHYASILCRACRAKDLSRIDTSIPLPFVTRAVLDRLMIMKGISEADKAVLTLQDLLNAEFSEKWAALAEARGRKPVQEALIDEKSLDRLV